MGVKFKSVTFPPSAVPPVPKDGLVYNDSATKQLMVYLNNQWVSLSSGAAGADGREVELQKNSTHIQWRYIGETNWNDLVALADITGSFDDSTLLKLDGSREMTGRNKYIYSQHPVYWRKRNPHEKYHGKLFY